MSEIQLKFDKMTINTADAERFLENEKPQLQVLKTHKILNYLGRITNPDKLVLIKLLQENVELYVQLEALQRGRSERVVRTEIKLLVNFLKNYEGLRYSLPFLTSRFKKCNFWLQNALRIITSSERITCDDVTAPISHLFMKHLTEAGFDVARGLEYDAAAVAQEELQAYCAGVVTEHSDIESAAEAFASSDTQCSWQVRHVYVQETVYEQFKKVLSRKREVRTEATDLGIKWADAVFFLGSPDDPKRCHYPVSLEAYRTTKELLKLLSKPSPHYLAVWSRDIAEANEIALAATARVTWINDLANFDTTANLIANPFISYFTPNYAENLHKWSNLSADDRINRILDLVNGIINEKCSLEERVRSLWIEGGNNAINLYRCYRNGKVEIGDGRIWLGIVRGNSVDYYGIPHVIDLATVTKMFLSLLHGNGLVCLCYDIEYILSQNDLPISSKSTKGNSVNVIELEVNNPQLRYDYIRTNYGTMFAN